MNQFQGSKVNLLHKNSNHIDIDRETTSLEGVNSKSVSALAAKHLERRSFSNSDPDDGKNKQADRTTAEQNKKLAKRIVDGDSAAFSQLLDQYEERLYRLSYRFTNNSTDAEDLTQEIFLSIYRSLPKFRGDSSLSTWIYRVAMNHCLEFLRRRKPESVPYNEELAEMAADVGNNPEEYARRRELSERLETAMRALTPQHRDVVELHELHGFTYQEVANILHVPVGTVKSRLFNAFRRLRDLMRDYIYEENRPV